MRLADTLSVAGCERDAHHELTRLAGRETGWVADGWGTDRLGESKREASRPLIVVGHNAVT